jgi:hypothetical protein
MFGAIGERQRIWNELDYRVEPQRLGVDLDLPMETGGAVVDALKTASA